MNEEIREREEEAEPGIWSFVYVGFRCFQSGRSHELSRS